MSHRHDALRSEVGSIVEGGYVPANVRSGPQGHGGVRGSASRRTAERSIFGPIREAADEDRDLRVATIGWEVLYLGCYAQRRPAEVVAIIARVCRGRLQLLRSG